MKVFAMNDWDWWAAETLEEAKGAYWREMGIEDADEDFLDDAHELDEEEMNHFQFNDDDGTKRSFREQLKNMIASGAKFPAFFASTEY